MVQQMSSSGKIRRLAAGAALTGALALPSGRASAR
jgi:hypothetical protein